LASISLAGLLGISGTALGQATVSVQPPRGFGYFPGDSVRVRWELDLPRGSRIEPGSVPVAGPMTTAIDLQSVRLMRTVTDDREHDRIDALLQIFFSPQEPQALAVPGFAVTVRQGGRASEVSLPGFSVTVAPFRHDLTPPLDTRLVLPDPAPALPDRDGPRLMLALGGGLAGIGGAALLAAAWLGRAGAGRSRAFRAAWRQIRGGLDGRAALLALHRAFDATAGRLVLADDLDGFVARFARFAPLRQEMDWFFALSRSVFFENAGTEPDRPGLLALCRKLAAAERRA
jgi:mxaA protein